MPAAQPTRVFILYGLNEGPANARALCKALQKAGIHITTKIAEADIVLSHSGGCYLLPQNLTGKTVIIVNPVAGALWTLPLTLLRKIGGDLLTHIRRGDIRAYLYKSLCNIWYMLRGIPNNIRMLRVAHQFEYHLPHVHARRVLVINNHRDPWARFITPNMMTERPEYTYVTLHGNHDDLWTRPQPYVTALQCIHGPRVLAQTDKGKTALSRTGMESA